MSTIPPGAFCWILELLLINAWIPMDLWLKAHGYELLTDEFREAIANPIWGPVMVLATVLTVLTFVGHMWWNWW